MPSKRSSNVKKTNSRGATAGVVDSTAKRDLIGVLIAVVAVALIVALVSPSSAVVTSVVSRGLTLGFGKGALLFPTALFLYAITFFIDSEDPISARIAIGLALVVLAVLALLSLNVSVAQADPTMLFDADVLTSSGGYIGAGPAWVLLKLVGQIIGNILLAGVIIAGIIVCGFSVSRFVTRLRQGAEAARIKAEQTRNERIAARREAQAMREASRSESFAAPAPLRQESMLDAAGEPVTTFLGDRKTTVLKRGGADASEAKTTLLGRKPKAKDKADAAASARTTRLIDIPETPAVADESIPEFLRDGAAAAQAAKQAKTTKISRLGFKRKSKSKTPKAAAGAALTGTCAARPSMPQRAGANADEPELPPLSLLASGDPAAAPATSNEELQSTAKRLQATLEEFGLTSKVVGWVSGPLVTTFKIEMGEGERVNRITNLEDDIALSLAAVSVRIFAPIPGTSLVGIEIPNGTRQPVRFSEVLPCVKGGPLEFAIGRDAEGRPVVSDLATMPHLLVAGTTGSGKSVMLNTLIMSMLMRVTPEQVRLIMIDPKRVEFSDYNGLPHLYVPVVTDPRQASGALQWAVSEMERRLKVFERAGVRDIKGYNHSCVSGELSKMENPPAPMPYLVIIIDELSDLMMVAGKEVEASIVRIAQLARAAGIHLVLSTQRPDAKTVTGLIKANIDNRIALTVSNSINSRVILDEVGAERLLGHGDMLCKLRGKRTKRVLGCWTTDEEIKAVVGFIKEHGEPDYHDEILSAVVPGVPGSGGGSSDVGEDDDPLVWEAASIVVDSQLGSTSGLQRRLKVGYARAGRIMDMLEQKGVVGPPDGSKPRDVLLDAAGLEELKTAEAQYREV